MRESLEIQKAIQAWQQCLSAKRVLTASDLLAQVQRATFETKQSVVAILYPQTVEEVQECVRIANTFHAPLYPISTGKNWGYGSKVPPSPGATLLSLEKMNRIIEFNEELAYITVEPGVTFAQVHSFLEEKESGLIAPSIGSIPEASLIGNAVERGIGKGQYGDRFQYACNMEIILPTGERIETGFGNFKNARSKNTYRWGVGPSLDGLFTQSNFGIVTRMTFWLLPKPAYFQTFFYSLTDDTQLPALIDALRTLRLEGTLTTTATISNDYRLMSMKQQFPFGKHSANQALPEEYLKEVRAKQLGGSVWVGDDAILAPTKAIGRARAARVKVLLAPLVDKLIFFDDAKATLFSRLSKPLKWLTGVDFRELLYFHRHSLYLGIPLKKQLAMCYFRKQKPMPEEIDLDRDRCGVIWVSPSVPFQGNEVAKALKVLKRGYQEFGFEPNIGLNFMSERNIAFTAAIVYDREASGQDTKAMACYEYMMQKLIASGLIPYRLGIQSMEKGMLSDSPAYQECLMRIKRSLDPQNILAPQRYGIESVKSARNTVVDISPPQKSGRKKSSPKTSAGAV